MSSRQCSTVEALLRTLSLLSGIMSSGDHASIHLPGVSNNPTALDQWLSTPCLYSVVHEPGQLESSSLESHEPVTTMSQSGLSSSRARLGPASDYP